MIARQTAAIFLDAYRELNAKKLFWVVLALSGLVVLATAGIGINDRGIEILFWKTFENPVFNTSTMPPEQFYKYIFTSFAIPIWLAWGATILALVSTASIFPDFISSGSIELALSKPISRVRLFLTKYIAAMLFVILQVSIFSVGALLVIGIRGGAWEPGILIAIPIVTLFFSYLYSVCVLLGVVTRSTIAALLLTLLCWFLFYAANNAEQGLLMFRAQAEMEVQRHAEALEETETRITEREEELAETKERASALSEAFEAGEPGPDGEPVEEKEVRRANRRVEELSEMIETGRTYLRETVKPGLVEAERNLASITPWHDALYALKTPLPKTGETIGLLNRWLVQAANLEEQSEAREQGQGDESLSAFFGRSRGPEPLEVSQEEAATEMQERVAARPASWVIGTSLGFEAVMLALAGFIFWRRDF